MRTRPPVLLLLPCVFIHVAAFQPPLVQRPGNAKAIKAVLTTEYPPVIDPVLPSADVTDAGPSSHLSPTERSRSLLARRYLENIRGLLSCSASLQRRCLVEALGTAFIIGCGSAVAAGPVLSALTWGLAVAIAVSCGASISGAHFNPAVTVSMVAGKNFDATEAPFYIGAQYLGAMCSVAALSRFGKVAFAAAPAATFASEVVITSLLLFGCLAIGEEVTAGRVSQGTSPYLVGLLITSLTYAFSHLGAGINPAMAFASRLGAVFAGNGLFGALQGWAGFTAYTVGPALGGMLGGALFALATERGQGAYAYCVHVRRFLRRALTLPVYEKALQEDVMMKSMMKGMVVPTGRVPRTSLTSFPRRVQTDGIRLRGGNHKDADGESMRRTHMLP